MLNESCEGIASADVVSIELANARGDRVPVFEYGAAYSFVKDAHDATPVFRWVDRNVPKYPSTRFRSLKYRTDRVDDVQIHLHIREIEFK